MKADSTQIFSNLVLGAGIALLLYVMWNYLQYTPNIPTQDEYITSLEFLNNFDKADSTLARSHVLLQRHSLHITLLANLVNVMDWKLAGVLNFQHLLIVAFLFLLGMVVLLQLQLKGPHRHIHALTIALLCINSLWYAATQPIAALQYFPVLALIAMALWLLSTKNSAVGLSTRTCFAALLITLATFSAGNGMFGFISAAVIIATRHSRQAILGWSVWTIFVVSVFFALFYSQGESKLGVGLKQDISVLLLYYLTFLGSIVQVLPVYGPRVAPFFGALLLIISAFLCHKKYYQKNSFITGMIVFMLISAVSVTLARCGVANSEALASRYAINSCLLVALLFIALLDLFETRINKKGAMLLCMMALLFNAYTLHLYQASIAGWHGQRIAGAQRYIAHKNADGLAAKNTQQADMILTESAERRIYNIENALILEQKHRLVQKELGYMYYNGKNLPQDYQQAYIWYSLAGKNSDGNATDNSQLAAEHLTSAELSDARAKANELSIKFKSQ